MSNYLEQAMRMGVACGISTVKDAVFNADYHYTPLIPHYEVEKYLTALYDEQDAWFEAGNPDQIPQHIIDEENAIMEAYFERINDQQEEVHHDVRRQDCGEDSDGW